MDPAADNPPPTTKRCTKCGREMPLAAYILDRRRPGRRRPHCRNCRNDYDRERRHRNIERERAKARAYCRKSAAHRSWYFRQPHIKRKVAARNAVFWAVRVGVITKQNSCEHCGISAARRPLQAHHTDYSRPLDVIWLCTRCHGRVHRRF